MAEGGLCGQPPSRCTWLAWGELVGCKGGMEARIIGRGRAPARWVGRLHADHLTDHCNSHAHAATRGAVARDSYNFRFSGDRWRTEHIDEKAQRGQVSSTSLAPVEDTDVPHVGITGARRFSYSGSIVRSNTFVGADPFVTDINNAIDHWHTALTPIDE